MPSSSQQPAPALRIGRTPTRNQNNSLSWAPDANDPAIARSDSSAPRAGRNLNRVDTLSSGSHLAGEYACVFSGDDESPTRIAVVWVTTASPKGAVRVREKLYEYEAEGAEWPLTACVLDPVSVWVTHCQVDSGFAESDVLKI